jgi:hypothetical protein
MKELFMKYPIGSEIEQYFEFDNIKMIVCGYKEINGEMYLLTDNGKLNVKRLESRKDWKINECKT